jgi:hypothetical protein
MKKIFFLILAFLFVVSFSFAQQEKNNRKDFQNFKGKGLGNKNQSLQSLSHVYLHHCSSANVYVEG